MLCVTKCATSWNYYILAYRHRSSCHGEGGCLSSVTGFWERPSTGRLQIMATLNTHSVLIVGTIIINMNCGSWMLLYVIVLSQHSSLFSSSWYRQQTFSSFSTRATHTIALMYLSSFSYGTKPTDKNTKNKVCRQIKRQIYPSLSQDCTKCCKKDMLELKVIERRLPARSSRRRHDAGQLPHEHARKWLISGRDILQCTLMISAIVWVAVVENEVVFAVYISSEKTWDKVSCAEITQ